jgi:fermentation-respiration switch protein FrsA (DUF1100 family)
MMQEKLIFFPVTLPQDYVYEFSQPFEELTLQAPDGGSLNAIHFKAESPKGVILYFHGNADNLVRWGNITERFVEYDYDVIVMDYRNFGKSTGEFNEENLYTDADLFYTHASKLYPEEKITVFGRSLGTTFAAYVASMHEPKQLILETPFYSLLEVAQKKVPFLPLKQMLNYRFPTFEFMSEVSCPVTIIHGTKDGIVPYESGQLLFEMVDHSRKNFITIKGGGHKNLIEFTKYRKQIGKILE